MVGRTKVPRRRQLARLAAVLVATSCLTVGCNNRPKAEESPFAPHWVLTTQDVGGKTTLQGGRGVTIDDFGRGNCQESLAKVNILVTPFTRVGAPTETTMLRVGNFDVRSQVTQLRGRPQGKSIVLKDPAIIPSSILSLAYRCAEEHKEGAMESRVVEFEAFGDGSSMSPVTGVSTFGWKAKLVPPWNKDLEEEGYTLGLQQEQNAAEWHEEAWYTVTSEQTLIILAIQGPSDPTKEFDYPALIDTMVKRVQADPPAQSWAEPEDLGW